jgi:hypothetical protein
VRPRNILAPLGLMVSLLVFAGTASAQSDDAPATGSAHAPHTGKGADKVKTKKPKTHTAKAKKATPKKKTPKPHAAKPKPHAHPPQKA